MNVRASKGAARTWGALALGLLLAGGGLAAGFLIRGSGMPGQAPQTQPGPHAEHASAEGPGKGPAWWTCSMHPQIRLPKPGLCPICKMELVPVESTAPSGGGLRELAITEEARKLMQVQTAPVERRFVEAEVRMVGKVDYDEQRLKYITAWVPGRLDRLFVDYTGVPVKKGDHMVYLYSPELLTAQAELLQALQALQAVRNLKETDVGFLRQTAEATLQAAREKLRLWGLTAEQTAEIEKLGKPSDHLTIFAPAGGIVIDKNAQQGMYVETGTRIYTIADLSEVWVRLDAYESDLMWVRYGQKIEFTVESYPGEVFRGTIAFIDPVLTQMTRTVKVRVNALNADMRLKPGMFVRAAARAKVAADGKVMDPSLAGKWMCPMHPDMVKDSAGACDFCGMPLVRSESLGYVGVSPTEADKPLVIPVSAALVTGTRAIVYVELPGRDRPTFEGRQVVLGPRAGDYYLIRGGLAEGERVVTRGNFRIDAELQIRAQPSMMSPEGGGGGTGHEHAGRSPAMPAAGQAATQPMAELPAAFRKQLDAVAAGYLAMQRALAGDDANIARAAAKDALSALAKVDMGLLAGATHEAWMKQAASLGKLLPTAAEAGQITALREQFALLSEEMAQVARQFGAPAGGALYLLRCPMAFNNRGALWLQEGKGVRNPYFGAAMISCGEVIEVIQPPAATETAPAAATAPAPTPAEAAGGHKHD